MNTTPDCHPEKPESGQQTPRSYFRPISYTGTLTHKSSRIWRRFFSAKATKRRERRERRKKIKQMTYKINRKMNSKENLDTCRTCLKCKHFTFLDPLLFGEAGYCSSKKEYRFPIKHCPHYEPADQ